MKCEKVKLFALEIFKQKIKIVFKLALLYLNPAGFFVTKLNVLVRRFKIVCGFALDFL